MKCSKEINPNCKSNDEIDQFLRENPFTLKQFEARPRFSNTNLEPLQTILVSEKKFLLKLDEYRRYDYNVSQSVVNDKLNRWINFGTVKSYYLRMIPEANVVNPGNFTFNWKI